MSAVVSASVAQTTPAVRAQEQFAFKPEDVKYHHVRYFTEEAQQAPDKSLLTHVIACKGGMTIAYVIDGTDIFYATATCHENDNFNKRIGRAKAAGRLQSANWRMHFRGSPHEFVEYIDETQGVFEIETAKTPEAIEFALDEAGDE